MTGMSPVEMLPDYASLADDYVYALCRWETSLVCSEKLYIERKVQIFARDLLPRDAGYDGSSCETGYILTRNEPKAAVKRVLGPSFLLGLY